MNLPWFEDFLALAASGNFSRAAEERHSYDQHYLEESIARMLCNVWLATGSRRGQCFTVHIICHHTIVRI